MSVGKRFSNSIVFTSVFLGSILGAGISLVASPDSRGELKEKILNTVRNAGRSVTDTLQHGRSRTVEMVTSANQIGLKPHLCLPFFPSFVFKLKGYRLTL